MPRSDVVHLVAPLLLAFAGASAASAQVDPSWAAFDGRMGTYPERLAVDAAGFAYVTRATSAAEPTIRTVKYAPDGTVVWETEWDDPDHRHNYPVSIAVDLDGSVYVCGVADYVSTFPPPDATSSYALLKYGPSGVLEWSRVGVDGGASAVALDHAGGVFFVVYQNGSTTVRRYSTSGTQLWATSVAGQAHSLLDVPTPGRLYAAGTTTDLDSDFAVARIDPATGAVLWSRRLDGGVGWFDRVAGLDADVHGDVALAGMFTVNTSNSHQAWGIALYDEQGNLRWRRQLGTPQHSGSAANAVAIDGAGRVVVTGWLKYQAPRSEDFATAVWDTAGNLLWVREYDSGAREFGLSVVVDADGRATAVGGRIDSFEYAAGLAIGYEPAGAIAWTLAYPGLSAPPSTFRHVVERDGGCLVSGMASGTNVLLRIDPQNAAYCFGDGSATPCPCGNASAPAERAGCANSLGVGGRLTSTGASSLAYDTLTLLGAAMPDSTALYFQGTASTGGGSGAVFGDGLRCAGGTTTRLATKVNVGGASAFPTAGDPPLSVRGGISAPGTRVYQVWYRNAASFCTSATFNLTNGGSIVWRI